nr:hypothetical protein [Gemmatimonadaceae bacterium]
MSNTEWVKRWNDMISSKPELPGVWRRKEGGFRIRGRTRDPKTGERRGVNRALPDCKRAREAATILETELAEIRAGAQRRAPSALPSFADWGAEVFARKVRNGSILSATGRDKWEAILRLHVYPAFGAILIDQLTREDVERWKHDELFADRRFAKNEKRKIELEDGRYSPNTVNTILGVLRQITAEASREFNIRDVMVDVDNAKKRGHRTYTYEDPNSLKPPDVPRFLAEMRVRFPDHYAFVFLGFTTGLRPSSLRPLRARGPSADVKWDIGKLLVRRSHTKGNEVMDRTKTGEDQDIDLDPEQIAILRWHIERLERANERRAKRSPHVAEVQRASELLFPSAPTRWSAGGGFHSRSCLDKAFTAIAKKLELGYKVSPRAMRRTFQDLNRAAGVRDIVTRAISGHATENMQRLYSTVSSAEMREGLAKVI